MDWLTNCFSEDILAYLWIRFNSVNFIEYKGNRKYISLKSGKADEIAQEGIKNFVLYLRKCGLSKRSQKTILLYHFGDGTNDGSGNLD